MPSYFTNFFNSDEKFMKDTFAEMKKELKKRGYSLKKHTFGYYEIYKNGDQVGLIDNYDKHCKRIYSMNSML